MILITEDGALYYGLIGNADVTGAWQLVQSPKASISFEEPDEEEAVDLEAK